MLFSLPKDNAMSFVYLISFFREMLSCSEKNKLTPEKISEILCECLVGEDRLAKSNSKKFRRENMVRADTASFFAARKISPKRSIAGSNVMAEEFETGETNEGVEDSESGNLSIEQMKCKMRY